MHQLLSQSILLQAFIIISILLFIMVVLFIKRLEKEITIRRKQHRFWVKYSNNFMKFIFAMNESSKTMTPFDFAIYYREQRQYMSDGQGMFFLADYPVRESNFYKEARQALNNHEFMLSDQ